MYSENFKTFLKEQRKILHEKETTGYFDFKGMEIEYDVDFSKNPPKITDLHFAKTKLYLSDYLTDDAIDTIKDAIIDKYEDR